MSLRPRAEQPARVPASYVAAWKPTPTDKAVIGGGTQAGYLLVTNDETNTTVKVPTSCEKAISEDLLTNDEIVAMELVPTSSTEKFKDTGYSFVATTRFAPNYTFWIRVFRIGDPYPIPPKIDTQYMVYAQLAPGVRRQVSP